MGKHKIRQLAEVRKHMRGSLAFRAGCSTGLTVRRFGPGPDGFTRFRPTPKPGTGLSVQFSPNAESWTRPGSSSLKVQVQTKVQNRTAASLYMDQFGAEGVPGSLAKFANAVCQVLDNSISSAEAVHCKEHKHYVMVKTLSTLS